MHCPKSPLHPAGLSRRDLLRVAAVSMAPVLGPQGTLAAAREKAKPLDLRVTDLKSWIVNHSLCKD